MPALCWTCLCKCYSLFSRQVRSTQYVVWSEWIWALCQHFQLQNQTVYYPHQHLPGFCGAGFDIRLCTEAEKEDYNTCPLRKSSFLSISKGSRDLKKKKKRCFYLFHDWPKCKSKQVEMGGPLALEVSNKVEHSSKGVECHSPTYKSRHPALLSCHLVLTNPWRGTGRSSAHHTPCFGHLPVHET